MVRTPASHRRIPIAIVTSLALIGGTLAFGLSNASATSSVAVRKFSATVLPKDCVVANTNVEFTTTITNSTSSNQPLGSALFHSNTTNGFYNIKPPFSTPVVKNAAGAIITTKSWGTVADTFDYDGIYLKASSSSSALAPGESVSVKFTAKTPTSTGNKVWTTNAWQSTNFLSPSFVFASGQSNPVVNVQTVCVGALDHFNVTASSPQIAGTAFPVTLTAKDLANNTVTSYTGSKAIMFSGPGNSPSGAPPVYPANVTFAAGAGTASVTLKNAESTTIGATDGTIAGISGSVQVNAGPLTVTILPQPTDTLISSDPLVSKTISPVVVTAKDAFGNPGSGNAALSLNNLGNGAQLNGGGSQPLDAGVATFDNLTISSATVSPTSSGYQLTAVAGAAAPVPSTLFAVANTLPSSCSDTDCTAEFPGGGTVTAPEGTTLIIENNDVVTCGDSISNPIAGTVTIVPAGGGNIDVTFVDPNSPALLPVPGPGLLYPFCKGGLHLPVGGQILESCDTSDGVPCVKSQALELPIYTLTTVITMNDEDPPIKH